MKKNIIAMIPAAGRGSRMLSLTDNCPKAMLPLRNKPIIGWHLDKLISENIKDVCIIVGYAKEKLIDYVDKVYSKKINVTYVEQKELLGLADGVGQGIKGLKDKYGEQLNDYSLLIILGDTIIQDDLSNILEKNNNFIGYKTVKDYSRWCLIKTNENGIVESFVDKPDEDPQTRKAVIGIYYFENISLLNKSIEDIIKLNIKIKNEFQLSSAMEFYKEQIDIAGIEFSEWYDCGEVDSFNKTRKNITRFFNSITITSDDTIIKQSTNNKKIKQEINWFLNIPNKLRVYLPQLIDYSIEENAIYELEYINFSPMQELFIYNLPKIEEWDLLFNKTFNMIDRFKLNSTKSRFTSDKHLTNILIDKTQERVNEMLSSSKYFNTLYSYNSIQINEVNYKNLKLLWKDVCEYLLSDVIENSSQYWQIIHGDLFFGNMLYDTGSQTLKVVDPRGNFGIDGIYGDVRYDLAKLMHSICGKYDFIVNDLFAIIKENSNCFEYLLYDSERHNEIEELFKTHLKKNDYDLKQITVITGLLFISMIPLHAENLNNQKMFYLIGIQLLNKYF